MIQGAKLRHHAQDVGASTRRKTRRDGEYEWEISRRCLVFMMIVNDMMVNTSGFCTRLYG